MTETERKALAWVNEVRAEWGIEPSKTLTRDTSIVHEAFFRAVSRIEELEATERDYAKPLMELQAEYEAFRREVSDKMYDLIAEYGVSREDTLGFIIPKPVDPFVALVGEAFWNDPNEPDAVDCAACILAGLKDRGLEIREVGHDKHSH